VIVAVAVFRAIRVITVPIVPVAVVVATILTIAVTVTEQGPQATEQPAPALRSALAAAVAVEQVFEQVIEHGGTSVRPQERKNPGRILMDEPGSGHTSGQLAPGAGADRRTD
jgi:hypothetical protein